MGEMSGNILLVCTVGSSPEAVAAAIRRNNPQRVIFVVSHETQEEVEGKILPLLSLEGTRLSAGQFDYAIVPDAQNLTGCVEKIREIGDEVKRWVTRGEGYSVIVDLTCGTKCMSASLALVARQWPCRFSYVGGTQRNKGGKGAVVSGTEVVFHYENPWDALGYQVADDASVLFDGGNYEAAAQLLKGSLSRVQRSDMKSELNAFSLLADAYLKWDLFMHVAAGRTLAEVERNGSHLRHLFPATGGEVVEAVKRHKEFLKLFEGDAEHGIGRHNLIDLCTNARRCAEKGRFDDAVARLYRAVEAAAQLRLRQYHRIETGNVSLADVPEPLRTAWATRATNGILKLGLQDAYELLAARGDDLGQRYLKSDLSGRQSPLVARNRSILAHGFEPVGEAVFKSLWLNVLHLAEVTEQELPVFPRLKPPAGERGQGRSG